MRFWSKDIGSSTKANGLYALPPVSTTQVIGDSKFTSRNLINRFPREVCDLSRLRKRKISSRNISSYLLSIVTPANFRNRRACDNYFGHMLRIFGRIATVTFRINASFSCRELR